MRKLRNTLYVFTEDAYLALDGENVVAKTSGKEIGRIPLHTLEGIVSFSYAGASPKLMGACGDRGISLSFYDTKGRFLACAVGFQQGNVLLRREQYRLADDSERAIMISRQFIAGKIFNARWVLERLLRDHGLRIDSESVKAASIKLRESICAVQACEDEDQLRGLEGEAASTYFGVFDEMILRDKDDFAFNGRNRRPPLDRVNAMLSLFYSVLASECAAALEGVGLDSYVGILHKDRPGRRSLALDLMEELRPLFVDRFIVSSINNRIISPDDFEVRESGEVRLSEIGRRNLFSAWQERKKTNIIHPYLKEKIPWGLVPHVQALLLARFIRGDLDGYPAFLWK